MTRLVDGDDRVAVAETRGSPGFSPRFLRVLGLVTALMGAVGLAGWVFGVPWLTSDFPSLFSLKPNAMLVLGLSGLSLWLLHRTEGRWSDRAGLGLAGAVFALGALTLVEYLTGWNLGIDQTFFRDTATEYRGLFRYPARMVPDTALGFTLIGAALLLARRSVRLTAALGFVIVLIGLNRLIAMAAASETMRFYVGISVPATVLFLLVGSAFLLRGFRFPWALGRGVTAVFAGAVTALIVLGMLSYRQTSDLIAAGEAMQHRQKVLTQIQAVWSAVYDNQAKARGYALTGREEMLENYRASVKKTGSLQEDLRKMTTENSALRARIATLRSQIDAKLEFDRHTIEARQNGGLADAVHVIGTGEGEALTQQIRDTLSQIEAEETRLLRLDEKAASTADIATFLILPAGTLFSVVILVLGLFRLNDEVYLKRTTQERFRLLVEGVRDYAILMLDSRGDVVSWNAGAERIKGYPAEEIIGRNFAVFYLPEEVAGGKPQQELQMAAERGQFESEALRVRKDGSRYWASRTITALQDEDGTVRGFSEITRDITARKETEKALREEHERAITELIESVNDGFVSLDSAWRCVRVNAAAAQLLHKTPEELLGRVIWELFPQSGAPVIGKELRRAMAERVPVKFEEFYPEPLNHWLELRCHPSSEGLNVFFIDIAERKSRELWLRQFSRAVEQSPSAVMITDTEGRMTYVNPKFSEMTGYSSEEAIGRNPRLLQSGEVARETYKELWGSIRAGREWHGEFHNRKKNGEFYWEAASISPITNEKGTITHFLAIKEDITERKLAETALVEAKQNAEQANKAKDIFLATLSHELRTPLAPVLLTASFFEHDETLEAELRAQFKVIRSNIELEARLIDDLLDITRISHGKFFVRFQSLDAVVPLSAALEIVRPDAVEKSITIAVDASAPLTTVRADPARLQQVFWNLLKNAIKFTPEGGRIDIRAVNPDPDHLAIDIRDTGIGIAPEFLGDVFQPFEQGATQGKAQFGGLGLGLAICKSIIQIHGGSISVSSEGLGKGSVFTVQLSLTDPQESQTAVPDKTPRRFASRRILLVEDNESTRAVLVRLLRRDGHAVEGAGTIEEALRSARSKAPQEAFDALICDLGLPDGSGLDVVREMKAAHPGLTAVALSGFGAEEDIRRSLEAGFSTHLVKPASIQELRRALER